MKMVNGEGILNPDICIVGEAPGADEEVQGRPFVGRSGKLIDKLLEELGIDRSKCYITNVVKFRPENNRTPTDDEINQWCYLLREELEMVKPKVVVTLGSVATKGLLFGGIAAMGKDLKITKIRGSFKESNFTVSKGYLTVLPTLHPSYCLRNPNETDKLKQDLKTALEYTKGNYATKNIVQSK